MNITTDEIPKKRKYTKKPKPDPTKSFRININIKKTDEADPEFRAYIYSVQNLISGRLDYPIRTNCVPYFTMPFYKCTEEDIEIIKNHFKDYAVGNPCVFNGDGLMEAFMHLDYLDEMGKPNEETVE